MVLTGTLQLRHSDNFRSGVARYFYALRNGRRRIALRFSDGPPGLAGGTRVAVHGVRLHGAVVVERIHVLRALRARRRLAVASGQHKVAVLLFNFTNDSSQPWSPDQVRGVMLTNSNSVNAYYQEESFGRVSLAGKLRTDGDVFGWYTIPYDSSGCRYDTWAQAAETKARAAGVDLSGYDHIVYAFPNASSCGWAGLAEMPGSHVWISGSFTLRVVGHELGHNLGVHHASSLSCTDSTGQRVSISGSCTRSEYGDPFDIMGSAARHTSNWHMGQYGWFGAGNTQTVAASGTFTLAAQEFASSGLQLLRIPRGSTGNYYYLEFRQPFGFDNFTATDPAVTGVSIRLCPDYPSLVQSQLIDTTPGTSSFTDAPLAAGRTFTDPTFNISVTTKTVASSGATVQVTLNGAPPPSDTTPPSAPGSLTAQVAPSGSVTLSWGAASDNVGVAGYDVFRGGTQIATTTGTRYVDTATAPSKTYTYTVRAYDAAGNLGPASNSAGATTPAPDTTPPSAPGQPAAAIAADGSVSLTWAAATDDAGVAGYQVFRDGALISTPAGTTYSDTGVSPGTTYTYFLRAYDAAGNVGPSSSATSVTTPEPAGGSGSPPVSPPPTNPPSGQPPGSTGHKLRAGVLRHAGKRTVSHAKRFHAARRALHLLDLLGLRLPLP